MRNSSLGSSAQPCEIFASPPVGKCFAEWLSLLQRSATRPTLPSIPELPFVSGAPKLLRYHSSSPRQIEANSAEVQNRNLRPIQHSPLQL